MGLRKQSTTHCSILDCEGFAISKGLCKKHYCRLWANGSTDRPGPYKRTNTRQLSIKERIDFYSETIPETSCIWWIGTVSETGYPKLMDWSGQKPKCQRVHRLVYEIHNGPIPEGLVVRHKCDNRGCVNPNHLEIGTQADNIRDMIDRGRQSKGRKPLRRIVPLAS